MSKKTMFLALFVAVLAPSLGFAFGECREDIQKYCPNAGMNKDVIKQCLMSNYKSLSPTCKQMVDQKIEQKVDQQLTNQSK